MTTAPKKPRKPKTRKYEGSKTDLKVLENADHLLDKATQDAVLAEYSRRFGATGFTFQHLEDLIDSEDGFGIQSKGGLSPLQRAICRVVEGIPLGDLATHPHVAEALGISPTEVEQWELRRQQEGYAIPQEVFVIAGIRTFKSLLIAAAAIWASQKVDVSLLSAGEIPRYSVVSLTVDNAKVVLMHLLGALKKTALRGLVVDKKDLEENSDWQELIKESSADLVGSKFLWHPAGVPIEIRVVAGKRAGGSTVSRWSAGVGLDEAPRMVGADQGVVNYTDIRRSVIGRLLPGAQLFSVGSPWLNEGPVYDTCNEWWGHPRMDIVIFKAPGPLLNPVWWNPARCAALKEKDIVAYQMDVLAEFADAGEALIPQSLISECTRPEPFLREFEWGHEYSAAMDPATRNNAWTLVISDRVRFRDANGELRAKKRMVYHRQWQGSQVQPLKPRQVLGEISEVLKTYHLEDVYTDQWSADALMELALECGFALIVEHWTAEAAIRHYLALRSTMSEGELEIPDDPEVHRDLRLVRRQVTRRGIAIHLSSTADGRHCDYAPALLRSISRWIHLDQKPGPEPGTPEAQDAELERWRQEAYRKNKRRLDAQKNALTNDTLSTSMDDALTDLFGRRSDGGLLS